MTNFQEIPLSHITPSPLNPRKSFSKDKLDELAASITQKGVIEPIIVRTVKDYIRSGKKWPYEIVAGERRYRASVAAGLAAIPAIVRELTDDEAYDFMLVENLQRDDLTEREEAESFKAYIGRHGEEAIASLAEKTGITPGYIRGRARVLELPAKVLKAWEEGKVVFGHLQQLLRVSRTKKEFLEETIRWLLAARAGGCSPSVRDLAEYIDRDSPALSGALFDKAALCKGCSANSAVQKSLFGIESKGVLCMNSVCFKKHQAEFLDQHWKETEIAKKNGTNGFRFREDIGYNSTHNFWTHLPPGKKCATCPKFVTIINLVGRVEEEMACAGEQSCFNAVTNPRSAKEKAKGERDPEAPRAAWHGIYFRDKFLRSRLADILDKEAENPDAGRAARLCLYALLKSSREGRIAAGAALGMKPRESWQVPGKALDLKIIKELPAPGVLQNMIRAAKAVILEGQVATYGGHSDMGVGGLERVMVADFLGVDLAKEYAVDKDYLEKKTKAEICKFIREMGLSKEKRVEEYWRKTFKIGWGNFESLKKTELIKLILKSGVDLVGKVPAEILKGAA